MPAGPGKGKPVLEPLEKPGRGFVSRAMGYGYGTDLKFVKGIHGLVQLGRVVGKARWVPPITARNAWWLIFRQSVP